MKCPNCKEDTNRIFSEDTPSSWACEICAGKKPKEFNKETMESKIYKRIVYVKPKDPEAAGGVFIKQNYHE